MPLVNAALLACVLLFVQSCADAAVTDVKTPAPKPPTDVYIKVQLIPSSQVARVSLSVPQARRLKQLDFNLERLPIEGWQATGELKKVGSRLVWQLPKENATLTYKIKVNSIRRDGRYDAYLGESWGIFRGEDLIPPARVRKLKRTRFQTWLDFELPASWTAINTPWLRKRGQFWSGVSTNFSLPKGWMIAGKLGTRHDTVLDTRITVSAPEGDAFLQMQTLAFTTLLWPQLRALVKAAPEKVLIVGGGEPMWRGGLSAPNALFLHSDRPLVSENGTSTLVHELIHSVLDLDFAPGQDWLVEGMAEYYAVELLYRAGFFTPARRAEIFAGLAEWGWAKGTQKGVNAERSSGQATARAAVWLDRFNQEIQSSSRGQKRLDDLLLEGHSEQGLGLESLKTRFEQLFGKPSTTLQKINVVSR